MLFIIDTLHVMYTCKCVGISLYQLTERSLKTLEATV